MPKLLFIFLLFVLTNTYSQTIKGRIFDAESRFSVTFANITVEKNNQKLTAVSDSAGFFRFDNLAIGRYDLLVSCVGYESVVLKQLLVNSGKQADIGIALITKVLLLEEVAVKPPPNEQANVSRHNLSIEQTNKYAGTWGDVARMAMSFAGVSSVNDLSNEIVIRGNSPKGLLWMIDGVEVPSPNHFSSEGASGGLVSALSTTVLKNSTFLTGAFAANYGNATSGVFDIKLRNGNNEKRESTINGSLVGIDIGTEGPFSKNKRSSYLFNYKFVNTTFVKALGIINVLKVATPKFQDLTFKLNFPFKNVNFSIWGLGGNNTSDYTIQSFVEIDNRANFYASGANLFVQLNKNSFWETILSFSGNSNINNRKDISTTRLEKKTSELAYRYTRLTSNFNTKINGNNSLQVGTILSRLAYNLAGAFDYAFFNLNVAVTDKILNDNAATHYLQGYAVWKKRWASTTLNTGLHASYFALNKKTTLEPRLSVNHVLNDRSSLNLGFGLHSRLEPVSVYLFKNTSLLNGKTVENKNLDITQSFHSVLGYTFLPNDKWRFVTEFYYQKLSNVGVGDTSKIGGLGNYSLINQLDAVNLNPLVSRGAGQNYGWELTAERSLKKGFYLLFTSSLFKSTYSIEGSDKKPTRFNNNFVFNLLSGKEWQIGKNILSVNLKNTWAGGIRVLPMNELFITDASKGYTAHLGNFYRLDFKVNYIFNFRKTTSTFSFDLNNLTNRQNPLARVYNPVLKRIEIINQLGLLPVLNYRLNF